MQNSSPQNDQRLTRTPRNRCPRCLEFLQDLERCSYCNWPGKFKTEGFSDEQCKRAQIKWELWLKELEIKQKAKEAVKKALKNGALIRPEKCSTCHRKAKRIEAHHWSYEPENWIDVIWLCSKCHANFHAQNGYIVPSKIAKQTHLLLGRKEPTSFPKMFWSDEEITEIAKRMGGRSSGNRDIDLIMVKGFNEFAKKSSSDIRLKLSKEGQIGKVELVEKRK